MRWRDSRFDLLTNIDREKKSLLLCTHGIFYFEIFVNTMTFEFEIRYVSNGNRQVVASTIYVSNYFIDWMIRCLSNWTCVNTNRQLAFMNINLSMSHIRFFEAPTTAPPSSSSQAFYHSESLLLTTYENSGLEIKKISSNVIVRLAFNHRLLYSIV